MFAHNNEKVLRSRRQVVVTTSAAAVPSLAVDRLQVLVEAEANLGQNGRVPIRNSLAADDVDLLSNVVRERVTDFRGRVRSDDTGPNKAVRQKLKYVVLFVHSEGGVEEVEEAVERWNVSGTGAVLLPLVAPKSEVSCFGACQRRPVLVQVSLDRVQDTAVELLVYAEAW